MAQFKNSIIDDDFQAWTHGPVCYAIWKYFKEKSVLHSDIKISAVEKKQLLKK